MTFASNTAGIAHSRRWLPLALLVGFGVLMGAMLPLAKLAMAAGVPPFAYAFWQCLGAGLLLLALSAGRRQRLRFDWHHLRYYGLSGLLGVALPNVLAFIVVSRLGTGLASVVYALPPLLTFLLALGLRLERPSWRRAAGIACGVAGMAAILLPGGNLPVGDALPWLLLALLTPVSLALGNIYRSADWPAASSPLALASGMMLASAAMLGVAMAVGGQGYLPLFQADGADWTIAVQIVLSTVGYVLFFQLQRLAGPVYLSQVGSVITLTGLAIGMAVFGERYSPWVWGGVAAIFTGIGLTSRRPPAR